MKRGTLVCALVILAGLTATPAQALASAGQIPEERAVAIADRDPKVVEQREEQAGLESSASMVNGNWEVAYFAGGEQVALVIVDPAAGTVRESWTGYQVAWKMARGYSGAFGHALNAPYVFLPLCALFLLGLVDWRRLRRVANLDLLVLLAFGVSHFFFNRGEIGVSVPLQYPALLYLLGRCMLIGFRGRGEGLRPVWPAAWLLVAALFLIGFRVGLNVADSGAIDVGYASVVGADRIAHGEPIYDNFPEDVSQGDTYGPVTYLSYVPFEAIWPWSGTWDDLPAAHGAAVFFDLATFALLILLGTRIRPGPAGRRLAATLAFGWAAYPYTAFALESNSNDTLVGMLLVATLLVLARPAARGAMAALATFAKFAPAVLAPMLLTYESKRRAIDTLRHRLRCGHRRGHALARDRSRPGHVLRPHHRLPGRPRLPVQHLGPGAVAGASTHRDPCGDRSPGAAPRVSPAAKDAGPGCSAGGGTTDRRPAHHAALVLPLHRLVLPARAGGARFLERAGYCGEGAGTITRS